MSDKKLLTESEVRRFMRLANLEPLAGNVVKENYASGTGMEDEVEESAMMSQGDVAMGSSKTPEEEYELEEEMLGGEEEEAGEAGAAGGMGGMSPEALQHLKAFIEAMTGEKVAIEAGEEEAGMGDKDMAAMDVEKADGEEDGEGEEEEEEEEGEGEEEDLEENASETLSEDDLVETVLSRVTARLVAEAKKKKLSAKDKKAAAERMKAQAKKAQAKKALKKEATDSKGGGPLIHKGGYKGKSGAGWEKAQDMAYGKGEKGGKGGHELEKVTAKAEHTVSHGKTNLATKGGAK